MEDPYYDIVLKAVTENEGPIGVNALSRLTNVNTSTLQKYLQRQTYFKQTLDRKWALPTTVTNEIKASSANLTAELVETNHRMIAAQLEELLDFVTNGIGPIQTLKRATSKIPNTITSPTISLNPQPVAEMHPLYEGIESRVNSIHAFLKEHKKKIPSGIFDEINDADYRKMYVELGSKYMNDHVLKDIVDVMQGTIQYISNETDNHLREYKIIEETDNADSDD